MPVAIHCEPASESHPRTRPAGQGQGLGVVRGVVIDWVAALVVGRGITQSSLGRLHDRKSQAQSHDKSPQYTQYAACVAFTHAYHTSKRKGNI